MIWLIVVLWNTGEVISPCLPQVTGPLVYMTRAENSANLNEKEKVDRLTTVE